MYELLCSQVVPHPRHEVFAFFSDIRNLERITPPRLHFKILTPLPCELAAGALIDYRLKLCGIPFQWQTCIDQFEPDAFFADTQRRGPYRHWYHEHRFSDVPEGTLIEDHVRYQLWGGPLAWPLHGLFIKRSLGKIFAFRKQAIDTLLASPTVSSPAREDLA
ncbi:MAG: SRPBCC family protein [Pirellulaceae bacterium]